MLGCIEHNLFARLASSWTFQDCSDSRQQSESNERPTCAQTNTQIHPSIQTLMTSSLILSAQMWLQTTTTTARRLSHIRQLHLWPLPAEPQMK